MDRTPVTSSNVASVGYNAESQTLEVEFSKSSGIYQYQGVPPEVYQGLVGAPSVGGYLAKNIKSVYPYQKVPDMPSPVVPPLTDDDHQNIEAAALTLGQL